MSTKCFFHNVQQYMPYVPDLNYIHPQFKKQKNRSIGKELKFNEVNISQKYITKIYLTEAKSLAFTKGH